MNHHRLLRGFDDVRALTDGQRSDPGFPPQTAIERLPVIRRAERRKLKAGHLAHQGAHHSRCEATALVPAIRRHRFHVRRPKRVAASRRQPTGYPERVANDRAFDSGQDMNRVYEFVECCSQIFSVGAVAESEDVITCLCGELSG